MFQAPVQKKTWLPAVPWAPQFIFTSGWPAIDQCASLTLSDERTAPVDSSEPQERSDELLTALVDVRLRAPDRPGSRTGRPACR